VTVIRAESQEFLLHQQLIGMTYSQSAHVKLEKMARIIAVGWRTNIDLAQYLSEKVGERPVCVVQLFLHMLVQH
jgi:predicted NBD/HSP70 family sugar kinase